MKTELIFRGEPYGVDLSAGVDISIPVSNKPDAVRAWYLPEPEISPVKADGFVGSVQEGGSVNFYNIGFNPHAHGTHTETVGHISKEKHSLTLANLTFHCFAKLLTVKPQQTEHGGCIDLIKLKTVIEADVTACIIRTEPNESREKLGKDYSNTNPAYLTPESASLLRNSGIKHLLIDQPSVDPEVDGGALAAHRAFWNYPSEIDLERTITELVYVPNAVQDGLYFMNLQVAPMDNDAAPSRPVLFELNPIKRR